jgi:hypothetical protein
MAGLQSSFRDEDRRHRGDDDRAGQSVTRSISLFNRAVMPSFIEGISSMRP